MLATGPLPLEAVAAAKSLAHWLTTGVPLTLLAPVLGLLLNLPPEAYGVLVATMLVGTPAISFIGAIGAALTLRDAARRPAAGPADAAAVRSDADFRHLRGQRGAAGNGRHSGRPS